MYSLVDGLVDKVDGLVDKGLVVGLVDKALRKASRRCMMANF